MTWMIWDTHVYRKPPFDKDSIDDSVDGKTFQHSHVPCFSTYNPVVFLLLHKVQSSVAGFICDLFGLSQNDGYQNSQHDHRLPSDKLTLRTGKSPFYSWVNPLVLWPFPIATLNYQRLKKDQKCRDKPSDLGR